MLTMTRMLTNMVVRLRGSLGRFSQEKDSFSAHLKTKDGVFFDEERIKQKMKEIQSRSEAQKMEKKKKEEKDFMKNYEIVKDVPKVKKFRIDTDTEALMKFEDINLDEKPTVLQITTFNEDFVEVDEFPYPPKIILLPNQLFVWELPTIQSIKPQNFKLIELVTPPPTYIIVGIPQPIKVLENKRVMEYLQSLKITFDVVGVFEAVSNFNNFAGDDVQVMAFICSGTENQ